VALALAGEFVPFAVNVGATEASETVRPYLPLAERLGSLLAGLSAGIPSVLEVTYEGQLADYDTRILTLSVLKGLFGAVVEEAVTFVNAMGLAEERGLEVRETATSSARDYVNLVTVGGGRHLIGGTLAGLRHEARIVVLDDHTVNMAPARHMLVVRNDDRPGMIGVVGAALGEAEVNIRDMDVGQSPEGESALMLLAVGGPVPAAVLDRLAAAPGIHSVHALG